MNQLRRWIIWISRIHNSRGFGIQSPNDYAFVRYVVNEHWPYYAYEELDAQATDWLERKLGRLYFRLANWRQPEAMTPDTFQTWWAAGCRKTHFLPTTEHVELARITIEELNAWETLVSKCNGLSVVVVEGIYRNWERWDSMVHDTRIGTTFDLYYCGIIFFDKHRYAHHYRINF